MKKLFALSLILMSTLPALAYVRDDTDTGWGLGGTILFFAILFIWMIIELKNQDKK